MQKADYQKSSSYRNYRFHNNPINYDEYYRDRDGYYRGIGWNPPGYAYSSYSSFGMWDAMWLWMILDHVDDRRYSTWAYHHSGDPGYAEWRREADRMATENADLKAKLASLDAHVTQMEGTQVDRNWMPDGVDMTVAVAAEVASGEVAGAANAGAGVPGVLVMGTGSVAGNYYPFCAGNETMAGLSGHLAEVSVDCVNTNGSEENLDGLASGRFDAALVQSDAFNEWLQQNSSLAAMQATMYLEYVQMIANEEADVESVGDLDPKRHNIYLAGSGARKTWAGFVAQDSSYAAFNGRLRGVPADDTAIEIVANDPNGVLVFVSGLNSDLLRKADAEYGDKLEMVVVDDWDFNDAEDRDGNDIYTFADIPTGAYPHLQEGGWFSSSKSVESLTVQAVFVLSKSWVERNGSGSLGKLELALWQTIPEIEHRVGQ